MSESPASSRSIRFDEYEVDLPAGRLLRRGCRVRLREQSFKVLVALLEHPGEVVGRDELCRSLWPEGVFVEFDNNLNTAVSRLRTALHDSADDPRYIETLPRHGYRFIGITQTSPVGAVAEGPRKPRLLVLPFVNLSGDPQQEYFSDSMTEDMITQLALHAPDRLGVIARTTAMHYKNSGQDIAGIARELNVDYVLEGSAQWTGDAVCLGVQLIQTSDQTHLFAMRYDCKPNEILETVSRASTDVATEIGVSPSEVGCGFDNRFGEGSSRRSPTDLSAYRLYLKGRHHLFQENPYDLAKAKEYLEEAVERDPQLAEAYDLLSEIYWSIGFVGLLPPKEACSIGVFYALRAIELDSTMAETHALLGMYRKELDYNWEEVDREMKLALRLNPSSPLVRLRYAISGLMVPGEIQKATREVERALESDPLSAFARLWMGIMLWLGRDYDGAIQQGQLMLELAPDSYLGYGLLGLVYRDKGVFREAIKAHRRAVEISNCSPLMLGWLGFALAQGGYVKEAHSIIDRLRSVAKTHYVPATSFAWTYLGLGEIDLFFTWTERAIDERDHMVAPIKSYPFFDPFRSDPRYVALLAKMNLTN